MRKQYLFVFTDQSEVFSKPEREIRMKIIRLFSALFLSIAWLAAFVSLAEAGAAGTTAYATITGISARDMGLDVYTSATTNPMECGMSNTFRIVPKLPNYNTIASAIMTFYISGKSAAFYVYGCDMDGASLVATVTAR